MFDELELLKFQVREELKKNPVETTVMVLLDNENNQYIDHFIEGDYSRTPPNVIQQIMHGLKLFKCTLGDLQESLVNECESRNQ